MSYPAASNQDTVSLKVIIACIITLMAVSTVFMTQPIFPEISNYFKTDITQARFTFSITSLFYAVSFFFIGPAVDRYNLAIIASIGLFALGTIMTCAAFASNFTLFTTILAVTGSCAALIPASMFPYVATIAPEDKTGLYVGSIVASATLGVIFGRVIMGILTSNFGIVISFRFFAGIIYISWLLSFIFLVKKSNKNYRLAKENKSLIRSYKDSIQQLSNFRILSLLLSGFCLFFGFLGIITFLTYQLSAPPFNFSAGTIGWISFAGISAIIAPFAGHLSQKIGVYKIVFPSLAVCLISIQVMGWLNSIFWVITGMIFLFLSVYSCQPLLFLLISKNVQKDLIGSASSLYILFCIGGGSLSSIVLGFIWNNFGWHGITIICSFFILLTLILVLIAKSKFKTQ